MIDIRAIRGGGTADDDNSDQSYYWWYSSVRARVRRVYVKEVLIEAVEMTLQDPLAHGGRRTAWASVINAHRC